MFQIAQRILNMSDSQTLAMAQKSRDLKALGIDIKNLSIGEPDFNTPGQIKNKAIEAIHENYSHYSPVPGYDALKDAIIEKFRNENQLEYKRSEIIVSTGAKQSLANVILSLINKDDEVIVLAPYWVSYTDQIKLAYGNPVIVNSCIENNFKSSPEQIEERITSKTKAILINSPSNPTGSIYSKDELAAIAKMLAKYPDIFIISDEIYEHINFTGKHYSIAQFPGMKERTAVINGVSKAYAMTGWRIGFMAAPEMVVKACTKLQGQITSGSCSVSQMAAVAALSGDHSERENMKSEFLRRRDLVVNKLREIPGLVTNIPEGAFYLFPNVSQLFGKKAGKYTIKNDTDLTMYLLEKAHVAMVPGSAFGNPNCIRLSYAVAVEELEEALDRIKNAIGELK